jgi:hypothetical protein
MDENRKVWQKPELIVLVRSKPEEAVLLACKMSRDMGYAIAGTGPFDCRWAGEDCGGLCNAVGSS